MAACAPGYELGSGLTGMAIAFVVALLGTPMAWRFLRGAARWPRIAAVSLCCVAISGVIASAYGWNGPPMDRTAHAAVSFSLMLQSLVLPFLAFLPRKAP